MRGPAGCEICKAPSARIVKWRVPEACLGGATGRGSSARASPGLGSSAYATSSGSVIVLCRRAERVELFFFLRRPRGPDLVALIAHARENLRGALRLAREMSQTCEPFQRPEATQGVAIVSVNA